jgi:hypothetical protein
MSISLAGFWFTLGGIALMTWAHDLAWFGLVLGGAVTGVGVLMLRARAVRPDLGDPLISDRWMRVFCGLPSNWERPKVPGREHRTWWTGDTKPPPI